MKGLFIIFIAITLSVSSMLGQTEQTPDNLKPSGKPFAKIFTNFHTNFSDNKTLSQFELTRVYLGYKYSFSKQWSAKANLDVGNPESGKLQMTAYIKNAFVQYENEGLTAQFGLIGTSSFKLQECIWGNRYMFKSFQDQYGMGPSADLGMSVAYHFCNFFSADVSILNGEGYKKIETDSTFKYTAGATFTPIKNFYFRVYYDYMKKDTAQQTLSFFAGYDGPKWTGGVEYNNQFNHGMSIGKNYSGYSLYTAYSFEKLKVYGRYDYLASVTLSGETDPWNLSKDGQQLIAGVEYTPIKGIKISPNYQLWMPKKSGSLSLSGAFLSLEISY